MSAWPPSRSSLLHPWSETLHLCKCEISLSCFALTPSWGDPILSSPGPQRSKSAVQTTPDSPELSSICHGKKKPNGAKGTDPNLELQRAQQVLFKLYISMPETKNDAMQDPTNQINTFLKKWLRRELWLNQTLRIARVWGWFRLQWWAEEGLTPTHKLFQRAYEVKVSNDGEKVKYNTFRKSC